MGRDAYTALVARPLFRAQERLKGHQTMRRLRELERSQWWDQPTLGSFQADRLRRFLRAIGSRVPYYRDLFRRSGFHPETLRGPSDLAVLPILTKSDIRAHRAALVAEGAHRLTHNYTGGSTGEPLQFLVGPARVTSDVALRCRSMRWWDVEVGDPEIVLWVAPVELTRQDRVREVRDRLLRSRLLRADRMTPERMDTYLDVIERVRPVQLFSYGSALAELARHAEERRRDVAGFGIRVAFLTAEQLYDHQRERIERVFGCRAANGYGARDAGLVASECPEGGMHVNSEDVVVEIVDNHGIRLPPGHAGQVVVTHLATEDFPFVRYGTGDVAVLHDAPCACGRGLPLLREIHGREADLLLSLDGARVPGHAIARLLRTQSTLKAFRIVQEAPDLLRILLLKLEEFPAGVEAEIVRGVRARLGAGMRVELVSVDEIPLDASGKYRTVVNKVGTDPIPEPARSLPHLELKPRRYRSRDPLPHADGMRPARDAYTALVAGPLFRIQERLKGHDTFRRLRELERSQWWDGPALAAFQAARLRRFLTTIGSRVPYYRDLYQRTGFHPNSVRGPEDLTHLPLLTKADIGANRAQLVAEGATKLLRNFTGGSTGEPLQFFVGMARVTSDVATRCRSMRWWNVEVGDPEIVLWAAPVELTRQDRVRSFRDRVLRSTFLPADKMTPERMDSYLDVIERVRPVQIFSHASALAELAHHAEERGRNMAGLGIRVAFLTAEQLYDHQRQRIERVFGCRGANGYGARDAGFLASECPSGGMHLNAEDVVVEIVDDRGNPLPPGLAGQVVVTHLESGEFPFVRYQTGDVAVLHDAPCACGRGLPLIREIHGRADDLLLGLDDARVPGQALVHLLRVRGSVKAFRIVQEARDLLTILIVKNEEIPADLEAEVVRGVQARLGSGMRVEFVYVSEISPEASGKYRTVVNKVGLTPKPETGAPTARH